MPDPMAGSKNEGGAGYSNNRGVIMPRPRKTKRVKFKNVRGSDGRGTPTAHRNGKADGTVLAIPLRLSSKQHRTH